MEEAEISDGQWNTTRRRSAEAEKAEWEGNFGAMNEGQVKTPT